MSQGILSVASGSGATVRAGFNAALARLATKASGTARPSDIAAGEDWLETDNPGGGIWSWWFYDGASDILLGTVNSSTHAITWSKAAIVNGLTLGSAWQSLRVNAGGTDLEYGDQYQKLSADGAPAGAGSFSFASIPASIKSTRIEIDSLIPATNGAALRMTLLDSGGSELTSAIYNYSAHSTFDNGTGTDTGSTGLTYVPLAVYDQGNNATSGGLAGIVQIFDMQSARHKRVLFDIAAYYNTGAIKAARYCGTALVETTSIITGAKFAMSSGNLSGALRLWGTR